MKEEQDEMRHAYTITVETHTSTRLLSRAQVARAESRRLVRSGRFMRHMAILHHHCWM